VLNVATGKLQTTAAADAAVGASATFFRAGRYWLEGMAPDASFGYLISVVRHRYSGEQYRVWTGTPMLDSPTYAVTPAKGEPVLCGANLTTTRNQLFVMVCGKRSLVKRCPRGCYAVAGNGTSGAFVEHGRLEQVMLHDARVLRSWRLPAGQRDRIKLLLTGNAVFASLLRAGTWHVFRAELAPRGQ
jgi:hypothetical protein